jgi:hypothetical protein
MHPYGCRVVQRVLEHGTDEQVNMLMNELRRFAMNLVQDQVRKQTVNAAVRALACICYRASSRHLTFSCYYYACLLLK